MSSPYRKTFLAGALLTAGLAAACTGGVGVQPASSGQSAASAAASDGPMQLVVRRIGPYTGGRTSSLRTQDMEPLFSAGNALAIGSDNRYLQLCSKYALSLKDNKGNTLSGTQWYLDKSEVIGKTSAELDRKTGELTTKFVVEQLYLVAYYNGLGAWAVLHMVNASTTIHSCDGGTPSPVPTPSGFTGNGQPGTDPDFGAF